MPTAGRMDDFSGAVGVYTLKVGLDREEAAANEAVSLTATVEGEGFLRAVASPILDLPPVTSGRDPISERQLRRIVAEPDWADRWNCGTKYAV